MADLQRVAELLQELGILPAEQPPAPVQTYMTCEEYGERIRVSAPTVRELVKRGLPHVRLTSRAIRVKVDDADKWLEERQRPASGRTCAAKGAMQ